MGIGFVFGKQWFVIFMWEKEIQMLLIEWILCDDGCYWCSVYFIDVFCF